jgi:hypothetical protein
MPNNPAQHALDLLQADATSPVDDGDLEDAVWHAVCDLIQDPATDGIVADWYWSRLALWDAMNGGVEQVVANHHRDLGRMAAACRRLGDDAFAALIEAGAERAKAFTLSPNDGYENYQKLEGEMSDLSDALFALESSETFHLDLIRAHRDAFAAALGGAG